MEIIEDLKFEKQDFAEKKLELAVYENCLFAGCNFENVSLPDLVFIGCSFENCNFSLANLNNTSFQDAYFMACKMTGIQFDRCKPMLLSFRFEKCNLNLASFQNLKIEGTAYNECSLTEVDFSGTDLRKAEFNNCDLEQAIFYNTILEDANMNTARSYTIDPENNYIRGLKVSVAGLEGFLTKYGLIIDQDISVHE